MIDYDLFKDFHVISSTNITTDIVEISHFDKVFNSVDIIRILFVDVSKVSSL